VIHAPHTQAPRPGDVDLVRFHEQLRVPPPLPAVNRYTTDTAVKVSNHSRLATAEASIPLVQHTSVRITSRCSDTCVRAADCHHCHRERSPAQHIALRGPDSVGWTLGPA
jgi:hypothetical protein